MLGDVVGIKAAAVESFDHLQALLVIVAQGQVVAVEVIENTEFHAHYPHHPVHGRLRRPVSLSTAQDL